MKNKEMNLIQSLLKEDKNFCRTPKKNRDLDLSSWASHEPEMIKSKERENFHLRLPKISEVVVDSNAKNLNNLNTNKNQEFSKVSRPIFNEIYIKLADKLIKSLEFNEVYNLFGKAESKILQDVNGGNEGGKGHYRSSSLQHNCPEHGNWLGKSVVFGGKKGKQSKERLFYYFRPEKRVEKEFVLMGKGESRLKGKFEQGKDSVVKKKVSRATESKVILPDIRSKSTISTLSLYNSGVPFITRYNKP